MENSSGPKSGDVLVGVDGGGTYSRGLCTDLAGNVVAYAEGEGTNPSHNATAAHNFQALVTGLLSKAGRAASDVACLAAGLAGLDKSEDSKWAEAMTSLPGLRKAAVYVNDAVVAHAGALLLEPGIIVVAGTGSITIAVMPSREVVSNYDFGHYARSTARHLAFDAVIRTVSEKVAERDALFIQSVRDYWEVNSLEALRAVLREHAGLNSEASKRRFGAMAPLVTDAASSGSPIARRACDAAADAMAASICLMRTCFDDAEAVVPVGLIGGVARSKYMQDTIRATLEARMLQRCELKDPALPPVCGAALIAAQAVDPASVATVASNLSLFASTLHRN